MTIENRTELVSETISRVINNAPVSEVLRVYSLAVQNEIEKLDDGELLSALETAGYVDLIEKYTSAEQVEQLVQA
jgi:hypothetical protein